MKYPIKVNQLAAKIEYYTEAIKMYEEASIYLLGFDWCKRITGSTLYTNLGEKLCIFLFEIDNLQSNKDNLLWIIVGDIPSMYLDTYGIKSTKEALSTYIKLSEDWINNIKSETSIDECYPFKTAATLEMAKLLEKKVYFIKSTVIENIQDINIK